MPSKPGAGRCRFCGCSELDACAFDDGLELVGCHWADRTCTVCSVCAPAAKAEAYALRSVMRAGHRTDQGNGLPDNIAFVRAFHAGFVVGWFGVSARSLYRRNPHRIGARATSWDLGHRAGTEASRAYQQICGTLENAPRRAWLRTLREAC